MSKYKVAAGFAFTAGGVVYAEGDEISLEQFGGNKAAFSVACGNGSQKTLEALTKKELEELAAKLKIETGGKKKEEIIAAIKKSIADYLAAIDTATDEQIKEFASFFGVDVKDKAKDEIIAALTELQK